MLNFDRSTVKHGTQKARIFRMIAASGFMTAFKCKKFVFGRGSAQTPLESLQRSPDPLAGLRGPTSKGKGRGGERRGKGRKEG